MIKTYVPISLLDKYRKYMPGGVAALFLVQIFATLGFSILYSTLILYATEGLKMNDLWAASLTGSFVALNFFLHLLGGYIGGRFLSYRNLFMIGMGLQLCGCLLISVPTVNYLLWGLALFLAGSGLNVTCINCMVTQLFQPEDKRREAAFLWNYSGMNIGFFIGFSLSGYLHLQGGYHKLFLLSSLGNFFAFAILLFNWQILKDRQTIFSALSHKQKNRERLIGISIIIGLIFLLRALLDYTTLCNQLILVLGVMTFLLMLSLSFKQESEEARNKIWAFIILCFSSLMFWALYQLAPMGLSLFIERNVDRHYLGFIIAPQWVQNINTIVIILGGPFLSVVFSRMRERGFNINIPLQFSVALFLIGIAFAILPLGIYFADSTGHVNFNWIIVSFLLQSIGELCISPIGYAMIGQLAPIKLRGIMMGIWLMNIGIAAILSDRFSKIALGNTNSIDALITNVSYSRTFSLLGWSAIGIGTLLFILIPMILRLTQEKRITQQTLILTEVG